MAGEHVPQAAEHRGDVPSWNNSTTIVSTLRDRMRDLGWAVGSTLELPIYGPAPELEHRPLDLGVGWWR